MPRKMRRTMVAYYGPQVPLDVDEAARVAVQPRLERGVGGEGYREWIKRSTPKAFRKR